MEMFSPRFYAMTVLVTTIVSLSITLSAANAQKAAQGTAKKVYQVKPLSAGGQKNAAPAQMPSSTDKNPRCLKLVSAEFTAVSGKPHKMNAIRAWRKKVAGLHGKKYSHWSISQKHKVRCSGVKQQKCVASAIPCQVIKWNNTQG